MIPRGRLPRGRVLIVDDSSTQRLWLESLLSDRHDVFVAGDGEAGVATAIAVRPDLILLDVVMPRMDGLAACRALRALEHTRSTPVILVTSKSEEWDVEAGFASGCTDYISKPVDENEFLAKVDSWIAASTTLFGSDS